MWEHAFDGIASSIVTAIGSVVAAIIVAFAGNRVGNQVSRGVAAATLNDDKRKGGLVNNIIEAVNNKVLMEPFGNREISNLFKDHFSDAHLRTVLPNYARGGYFHRLGAEPVFERVKVGKYRLIR